MYCSSKWVFDELKPGWWKLTNRQVAALAALKSFATHCFNSRSVQSTVAFASRTVQWALPKSNEKFAIRGNDLPEAWRNAFLFASGPRIGATSGPPSFPIGPLSG